MSRKRHHRDHDESVEHLDDKSSERSSASERSGALKKSDDAQANSRKKIERQPSLAELLVAPILLLVTIAIGYFVAFY